MSKKRIERNSSLLASEEEACATSRSLYGDHQARISSNLHRVTDRVRISAFSQAITNCVRGKTVLHLGCGIGLLSMLAARANAAQVVGVDTSAVVNVATEVAKRNKLDNVQFFQGTVRDGSVKLPIERFDVILCEWMGSFLTNEPLFLELLHCRKHHLAVDGVMCPNRSSLHVVGVCDYQFRADGSDFWDNVYGFKMSAMKPLVAHEISSGSVPKDTIVTPSALVHAVDMLDYPHSESTFSSAQESAPEGKTKRIFPEHAGFEAPFSLNIRRKATLHFLTFYIDATFNNKANPAGNFVIGFQPGTGHNSWTEVSAALPEALPVFANDVVTGTIRTVPLANQHTEVYITVKVKNMLVDHESTTKYMFQY